MVPLFWKEKGAGEAPVRSVSQCEGKDQKRVDLRYR